MVKGVIQHKLLQINSNKKVIDEKGC